MTWLAFIATALAVTSAGLATLWLRRRLVVIEVDGQSMEPTLHAGEKVLVRRAALGRVRVGDIVVVEDTDALRGPAASGTGSFAGGGLAGRHWLIKRVAALPGGPVPAFVAVAVVALAGDTVPPDRLVLLGDNAALSRDSRDHGYYHGGQVLGVVVRPMH